MDDLKSYIKLHRTNLEANDVEILRREVLKLEDDCRAKFKDLNSRNVNRMIWIHLVELSIETQNVQLSLLIVAKLKLIQLALLIRATLLQDKPSEEERRLLALSYVANYFNIDAAEIYLQLRASRVARSSIEQDHLLEFFINSGDWSSAIEHIDSDKSIESRQKAIKRNLVYHKLAVHFEQGENYPDALKNFERSGNASRNTTRLILKRDKNMAFRGLKEYCITSEICLRKFWVDFLLASGACLKADERNLLGNDHRMLLSEGRNYFEAKLFAQLPEKMRSFIGDMSSSKWFNNRQINYIISSGTSLNTRTRKQLAQLASHYRDTNLFSKTCNLLLCLGQIDLVLSIMPKFTDHANMIKLLHQYGRSEQLATFFVANTRSIYKCLDNDKASASREGALLFTSYLRLGLLNEALDVLATKTFEDEAAIIGGIEYLETLVEKRFSTTLNNIDPVIKKATLTRVLQLRTRQILSTHVITIVLLTITIFLNKIENVDPINLDKSIANLNTMFKLTSDCFAKSNLAASDSLVRSVSSLVNAVKERLDLLAGCDTIRDGFRQMVETTADLCMVESRYKSAAMLYNHIEDHRSAVKSLMRMGDLDVVINYSLLVRDIAVNRITINYLKHLGVDEAIVKDFIARSQL